MKHWPIKPLEEIADLFGGSTPSRNNPAYWNGDIHWATPSDLPMPDEGICVVSETRDRITKSGLENSGTVVVPKGTVLFSSRATIGKVGVASMPLTTNQGFANFVPGSEVTSRFLAYTLWHRRHDIARLSGSTTFKEVGRGTLRKYQIPVPPLAEQKRIVKLLDKADELRKLRTQANHCTADFTPALFHEMFGKSRKRAGRLRRLPIGELVKFGNGATPSKANEEFWTGKIPWVSPKDMKTDEIFNSEDHVSELALKKTNLHVIPKDTVLIVVRGMILAHTVPICLCRVPITINQDMKALLPTQAIEPEFLHCALQSQHAHILNQVTTAAHGTKKLDSEKLKAVMIPVPPLPLQKEFAQRVREIRDLESVQAQSRACLETLFASLLDKAFKGKL